MHDAIAEILSRWVKGNREQALGLCQKRVEHNSNSLTDQLLLGILYLLMGQEEQANELWLSLFEDPVVAESVQDHLDAIAHTSFSHRAFQIAEMAERLSLDFDLDSETAARCLFQLGRAIAQQGQYDEALEGWQQAVQIDPQLLDAYRYQAEMLQHLGEWQAALEGYQAAYRLNSTNADLCDRLALCHSQLQQWEQAEQYWQTALSLNPNIGSAYANLAFARLNLGRFDEAIATLQQWVHHQPVFVEIYCAWAELQPEDSIASVAYPVLRSLTPSSEPNLNEVVSRWSRWLAQVGYASVAYEMNQWAIASGQSSGLDLSSVQAEVQKEEQAQDSGLRAIAQHHAVSPSPQSWLESTSHLEISVYPSTSIHLVPPKSTESDIHYSFRFGDTMSLPESFVTVLKNGRCWFDAGQTSMAILTEENQLVPNLSPQFPILSPANPVDISQHRIFQLPYLAPVKTLSGTTVVLAGLLNSVYFHWMLDVLPRLDLLAHAQIDWKSVDHIVVPHALPFQRETLAHLGISLEKCIDPGQIPHLQAESLIVPSFPAAIAWFPRWACDFLRQQFLPESVQLETPSRRLYITRGRNAPRIVLNEAEVTTYLQGHNFEVISLEDLSVSEQAHLLAQASIVVAPHGSGLTNLVFCQSGTQVIELFSPDFVYSCYWFLSTVMELEYAYLLGEKPEGHWLYQQLYTSSRLACITIDIQKLDRLFHLVNIC